MKKGKYRDNKGNLYTVIGETVNAVSGEKLVLYTKEGSDSVLAMPEDMWNSVLLVDGKYVNYFNPVAEKEPETKNTKTALLTGAESYYCNYRQLYDLISSFLEELKPDSLRIEQLREYDLSSYVGDMPELCRVYFGTIQDYQFMPNVIGFNNPQRKAVFNRVLFGFNHLRILEEYDEGSLFEAFCDNFPVKNRESKTNSWRRYAKGIISICEFLSDFDGIDEYNRFCESFEGNKSLPGLMSKKISGMGFALACNLLKDTGFNDFCKPDVHLRDVLSKTGYCGPDDYSVFDCVRAIADANKIKARTVDSRIWLICSGNYYNHNISIGSNKDELIRRINVLNEGSEYKKQVHTTNVKSGIKSIDIKTVNNWKLFYR